MITGGQSDIVLSIGMLGVFALVIGAIFLFRRSGERKRAILMLIAAAVLLGNILIWTVPV
jgi:LPXTG-motif cell wall-anchored protein